MLLITLSKLASYPAPLTSSLPSTGLQLVPQRPLAHKPPRDLRSLSFGVKQLHNLLIAGLGHPWIGRRRSRPYTEYF
jgi:hypothetical protein